MLLTIDPDSIGFKIGEWAPGPVLMLVGLLLLLSGRRAEQKSPGSGATKRGWGIGLIVVFGLLFAGRIAAEVREAADNAPKDGAPFAEQPAKFIAETGVEQMKNDVTTLRITGETTNANGRSSLEATFDIDGRCRAEYRQQDAVQTYIFDGQSTYLKANRAGWVTFVGTDELAQDALDRLGTKWAVIDTDELMAEIDESTRPNRLCDIEAIFGAMAEASVEDLIVEGTTRINGVEAVELTDYDVNASGSLWVETAEPHHVLRFQVAAKGMSADFSFSDFNERLPSFKPRKRSTEDLR